MARETFGIDIDEMSTPEIRREIAIHKKTVNDGRVGTPNVYVRLGDLQRALAERQGLIRIEDRMNAMHGRYVLTAKGRRHKKDMTDISLGF